MNGKSVSIPFGMIFKKFYCSKCGARLEKVKTHRVVTKDDEDYFCYQDRRKFPYRDYDVYGYEFKCPSCNNRISYEEQCAVEKIQKHRLNRVVHDAELYVERERAFEGEKKNRLKRRIISIIISFAVFWAIFFFAATDRTLVDLAKTAVCYALFTAFAVFKILRRSKDIIRTTEDREALMERLHAYSSNNKEMIEKSEMCYCFYCKSVFDSREVVTYFEDEKTALCPRCNIDSVIPDSIYDNINEEIISQMHDYWF